MSNSRCGEDSLNGWRIKVEMGAKAQNVAMWWEMLKQYYNDD